MANVKTQLLVDTGARLSCISEQLLQCHELLKNATIRKSDKRAYGVNGEPVVTLGIVDLTFHVGGLPFSHSFTILRGLIHPMLLGMDFLSKHRACINLGNSPSVQLVHSSGKVAATSFIKAMPRPKQCTHVASAKEIEIPPHSFYYADAYLANFDCADNDQKVGKLLGITSIQKVNDFFDPGFILRDAVIEADSPKFKVELANPSEFSLKIQEDTPLGLIFDYDCEILETDNGGDSVWETPPTDASEEFLRRQAMLIADVNLVECESEDAATQNKGPSLFTRDPSHPNQQQAARGPSSFTGGPVQNHVPEGAVGSLSSFTGDPCNHQTPPEVNTTGPSLFTRDPVHSSSHQKDQPTNHDPPNKDEFVFTMAYSDMPNQKLLYSDIHGKGLSQKERMYMVNMDDADYTPEQRAQLEKVLEENAEAFSRNERETGCTDLICHHVKITNPRPVHLSYHKAQGADIRKEIDDQTNSMLADGIVVESESPYCCPIVMVRKKYGGWRYCVDLRKINQMTEKVTFPMPRIDDALRKLRKPKYFSSMDLLKAYYQIPVAEEDQKYYAFSDGRRHLAFTRCPMGAKNSGSTLAMLMELVLRGLPPECVIGYLDDILLATEDWVSHMELLDKLLKAIIKAKLKLCPIKCQFARLETKTLGHVLSQDGIRPDKHNLDKIKDWTEAKNVAEVRTFLGITGYYRSLIKNYAHIASPLTDLLHNDREWKWGKEEKEAFQRLKQALLTEPVASYPDYDLEFRLHTDASKVALGAVLAQEQEKKERMIACMSKKFTTDELKWAPYDREFLAMILPTRHFSHYLRWKPFKLFTDHKPLLAWKDVTVQKDGSGKRTRWVMELSTYDVEVIHKAGKSHGNADALSRHPNPDEPDPEDETDEVLSAMTDDKQKAPDDEFRCRLRREKTRVSQMVRELSKYDVQVMFREKGKNVTHEGTALASQTGEGICSLTTDKEIELNFVAAHSFMEIALVEIHADEATEKEMMTAQAKDENISKTLNLLKRGTTNPNEWKSVPQWFRQNKDKFVVRNNVLFHVKTLESGPEPIARTVIPSSKVKEMLFRCHGCIQSGHPGHVRALARMEKFAVWPNMSTDIKTHVERCAECQAARQKIPKRMAPVQVQKAVAPLQFVQADLFKTGLAAGGMQYICVFEDRYTKLCRLFAIKDAKAKSVAKCIESFVVELGCPTVWSTDGGPEFYNTLMMAICHVFQIKKEFALAYRPQTQGQTERKNRTIKAELVKRISQFGKSWPSYLKWIELAYNTTNHPSHGFTPFLLMYGREAKLPMQVDIPKFDTKGWKTTMKSYLKDFLDRMAAYRKQVMVNRTLYQLKMAQAHDGKLLEPLKPGEKVLREIPDQFRTKLDLPRDGPWEVQEQRVKEGRVLPVYKIRNDDDKTILAHREVLTQFLEPTFSVQKQPPNRAKKDKTEKSVTAPYDGPATRTRARTMGILPLRRLNVVSDGDDPDGDDPDSDDPDGEDPDGDLPDGDNPDGDDPEGGDPDEDNPDGVSSDDDRNEDPSDEDSPNELQGNNQARHRLATDELPDVPSPASAKFSETHSEANSANQFSELESSSGNSGGNNTPENTLSGDQSTLEEEESTPENSMEDNHSAPSSNYATPESLDNTAIEMVLIREPSTSSAGNTAGNESLNRPSLASTSSVEAGSTSLLDVFASPCSADERVVLKPPGERFDWVTPEARPDGRVTDIVVDKDGNYTEVRRSSRLQSSTSDKNKPN